ncbi:transcription termination factor NusA, partial [Candidatus Roizmanbacteria bacterium CG10_big_fil_rev_8_21_14_0_10_39_6]
EEILVKIDPKTGGARLFQEDKDITPPGFGRIAAQTAKQVIIQKIREAEKKSVVQHFKKLERSLITGRVIRFDGKIAYVDIGRTEAVLPPSEQIRNERYYPNTRLVFYLMEVIDAPGMYKIILSRKDERLIQELFRREVPELAQGMVEIRKIVREAGERTKIAVYSKERGVDPVGSCVGQKGVRIQSVIHSLSIDEKIDVVQWSEDQKTFITNAISPSKPIEVEIHEEEKLANIFVDSEELPLIIGREGQNIRLASKLTGYTLKAQPKEEQIGTVKADL